MPFLDFKGKSVVYSHHLGVPFRSLKADEKKSLPPPARRAGKRGEPGGPRVLPDLDDNLIIHGDNLHALKALLPRYSGKIKCVYIDPPYNTGNEGWKYNDKVNSPVIKEWLKENGIGPDDQERHDKWLCMIWPRLQLLKELLADDGVIFVSIDDNEQHHLRMIMNEIFGEENFISNIGWQKKFSRQSDAKFFSSVYEFIVGYAKNADKLSINLLPRTQEQDIRYSNSDKDPRGKWSPDNMAVKTYSKAYDYTIITPSGRKVDPPRGFCWRFSKQKFSELVKDNRIWFGKNGDNVPRFKRFLSEVQHGLVPTTLWLRDFAGDTQEAVREVKNILTESKFDSPKPAKLIKKILNLFTNQDSVILDSFAGSGTTAHAVLDLNKEDGGKRKFILVECEDYADKITAERVRRVIKGVPAAKNENLKKGLGGSFTYCSLGEEINAENMLRGKLPDYKQLAEYIFYTAAGKSFKADVQSGPPWFIGETKNYKFHLVYKPDLEFLKSKESALHSDLAETVRKFNKNSKKTSLVYAPASYITQKELSKNYNIQFCQLPYAVHKIIGV